MYSTVTSPTVETPSSGPNNAILDRKSDLKAGFFVIKMYKTSVMNRVYVIEPLRWALAPCTNAKPRSCDGCCTADPSLTVSAEQQKNEAKRSAVDYKQTRLDGTGFHREEKKRKEHSCRYPLGSNGAVGLGV